MSAKFKIEEIPVLVKKNVGVILELTLEEAVTLTDLLGSIGGNPDETARGYIASLLDKLCSLGLSYGHITARDHYSIWYKKESLKQVENEVKRLQA